MSEEKLTEKPSFFAQIPSYVRYDKTLSATAKLLYGEITALLQFNNKCFASNAYFSRVFDVTDVQISRLIKQLVDAQYIITETEITSKGSRRLIKLPLNINVNPHLNKNDGGGINKNVKHNSNSINNNTLSKDKDNGQCSLNLEAVSKPKEKIIKHAPTLEDVKAYFKEKDCIGEYEKFYNYYDSIGWMIGKHKIQKWKSAASNWILKNKPAPQINTNGFFIETSR